MFVNLREGEKNPTKNPKKNKKKANTSVCPSVRPGWAGSATEKAEAGSAPENALRNVYPRTD